MCELHSAHIFLAHDVGDEVHAGEARDGRGDGLLKKTPARMMHHSKRPSLKPRDTSITIEGHASLLHFVIARGKTEKCRPRRASKHEGANAKGNGGELREGHDECVN